MTQETRDTIYNKKAEELNKDEVRFINELSYKKTAEFNFWLLAIFGPIMGFALPAIFAWPVTTEWSMFLPFMTGVGGFLGVSLGAMFYLTTRTLKSLGLTRKDWKELKKSGRLKELKQVVKEYNTSKKSSLDNLMERELDVQTKLELNEQVRQNLHTELKEIKEKEERLTGKTTHYTQEQVADMLKAEESLLIKAMERVKQTQAMINEETDEKTLNEVGDSIKNRDYLTNALEACKQFNQEFDGETIDN